MSYIELKDIDAGYVKGNPILKDFNLSVEKGELLSLLGPSGCGKTTTLRTIAGFIMAEKGQVLVNGKDYTRLPPNKRNIGLVFQTYALFPHLSVFDNVAYGLKRRKVRKDEIAARVASVLELVSLTGYEDRLPAQLSGGQRQRVALARSIVIEPDLLLLDEPLSNLDAKLREEMRAELSRLQHQLGITMIYVTHDQIEALSLSSRIIIMNKGEIEQMGSPEEVYSRPATPFVAGFMGFDNSIGAVVESVGEAAIRARGGELTLDCPVYDRKFASGDQVELFFRAEDAELTASDAEGVLPVSLNFASFQGNTSLCSVRTADGRDLQVLSDTVPAEGGSCGLRLKGEKLMVEKA
jgi:putative spermidine/putrescine transport system ATP-binding protein